MSRAGPAVEPYNLDPMFQRVVAALLATRPKFFGLVGAELEPARFADPAVATVVRAVQAHAKDAGRGPSAAAAVIQRVRRWVGDGKQTAAELDAVVDLLEEELARAPIEEGDVLTELVPVLQQLLKGETALAAIDAYKKDGDFDKVAEMVRRAQTLGRRDRAGGSRLGVGTLGEIRTLRAAERLETGIFELDVGLGGGLPRGKLGIFVAPAKAGKSMYLTHQIAHALLKKMFVLEATLELSEEDQQARLIANLTGLPIDAVMDDAHAAEVRERLEDVLGWIGPFATKFFPAKVTTMTDVTAWVKEEEDRAGRKVDLLVVDYIDKVGIDDRRVVSSYEVQGQAAEDLRLYCHGRGIYGWTASQPKRRDAKDRAKRIEIDDMADSINKGRVVDLVLTCTRPSDGEIEVFVAGNRHGRDGFGVGPLPHNLACAQVVDVPRY